MGRYLSVSQCLRWTLSYPIEEQGHSPSQWVLWTLSYPVHETDRRATFFYFSTSTNLAIFVQVANSPKHDGPLSSFLARGTGGDLHRVRSTQQVGRAQMISGGVLHYLPAPIHPQQPLNTGGNLRKGGEIA